LEEKITVFKSPEYLKNDYMIKLIISLNLKVSKFEPKIYEFDSKVYVVFGK